MFAHCTLWERGRGSTTENLRDGSKVTVFFRKPQLRADGVLPKGGIAPSHQPLRNRGSTARWRSTRRDRSTRRCLHLYNLAGAATPAHINTAFPEHID
jgi:hypothetical protein